LTDFEQGYFETIYGGDYDRRNPEYKTRGILDVVMRFETGGRLLDIGCAYGAFLKQASLTGTFELYGTDISAHAVEVAGERLGDCAQLQVGGLFDSTFEPGFFDVVCLFDVIEHIEDQDAAFERIRELLRPSGLLALTIPVYDGPLGPIVQALDKDPTHLHKIGREDWVQACRSRGFDVMHWIGLYRYFVGRRFYAHYRSLFARRWAPAIMLVARPR
jgi:SAM-dependent methyltransferase